MARMVKGLMTVALLGAMAYPASGHAIQVDSAAPTGGFNLQSFMGQQLQGQAALNALSMANGLNLGNMQIEDFGKMLAVSMVQSALSGNFDPQSMFGNMANMMMVGAIGNLQQQLGLGTGLGGVGGVGNFGGLGTNGGSFGLFGGGGLEQALLGTVLQTAVDKLMGGIQGGSSGGGDNIGGVIDNPTTSTPGYVYNPLTGKYDKEDTVTANNNYKSSDEPTLARADKVVESGVNYTSGYYDAMDGLTPDARFQFVEDGAYDNNYWAGYQKGLDAAKKAAG